MMSYLRVGQRGEGGRSQVERSLFSKKANEDWRVGGGKGTDKWRELKVAECKREGDWEWREKRRLTDNLMIAMLQLSKPLFLSKIT